MSTDIIILITASLVAINSAILGSFLLLRKKVMMGDAISHAVLPGIFLAYFISGGSSNFVMLMGAALSGMLATIFINFLTIKARLQSDAAIGISFTFLFSIGVILFSLFGKNIDLDPSCILFGELEYVPFDPLFLGNIYIGPKSIWYLSALTLLLIIGGFFVYRQLKLTTFDPGYALTLGVNLTLWNYVLLGTVSLNTVLSFESVGAILVIVFLAAPPAMAFLVTKRLKQMIVWASIFGIACSILGYFLAIWLNVSVSGSIALVMGLMLAGVFLWSRRIVLRKS